MYKKIVVCDISGTLIDSKGRVNENIKESINVLENNNVGFILCSGGARVRTIKLANDICASKYFISSNGADVYSSLNNREIYSNSIDITIIKRIYMLAMKYGFRIALNSVNNIYSNILIYNDEYEKEINGLDDLDTIDNIVQCIVSGKNFNRFMYFLDELKEINDIAIAIKNVDEKHIDINSIKVCYSDIVQSNTSKGIGLEKLCNYLKLKKEDVISIGDSVNDLSLFDFSGYHVAMGNAIDELKDRSDYVTKSNDEDGVNYFLKQLIKRM